MTVKRTVLQIDVDDSKIKALTEKLSKLQKTAQITPGAPSYISARNWDKTTTAAGVGGVGTMSLFNRAGGQLPIPQSSAGVSKIFGAIPLIGGLAAYNVYKIFSDFQKAKQISESVTQMLPFGSAKNIKDLFGSQYGINPQQSIAMKTQYARASGLYQKNISDFVLQAFRGVGLNAGVTGNLASVFSAGAGGALSNQSLTNRGLLTGVGSKQIENFITKAISTGTVEGIEAGKLPQYFANIQSIMQQIGARGVTINPESLLHLSYGLQMATGGARGAFGGALGMRAVANIANLQSQIVNEGGDNLMRILAMRGFGFGQGKSYIETMQAMEKATPEAFLNKTYEQMGFMTPAMRTYFLHKNFGMSYTQAGRLAQNLGQKEFELPTFNIEELAKKRVATTGGAILKTAAELEEKHIGIGFESTASINALNKSFTRMEQIVSGPLIGSLDALSKATSALTFLVDKALLLFKVGTALDRAFSVSGDKN